MKSTYRHLLLAAAVGHGSRHQRKDVAEHYHSEYHHDDGEDPIVVVPRQRVTETSACHRRYPLVPHQHEVSIAIVDIHLRCTIRAANVTIEI